MIHRTIKKKDTKVELTVLIHLRKGKRGVLRLTFWKKEDTPLRLRVKN